MFDIKRLLPEHRRFLMSFVGFPRSLLRLRPVNRQGMMQSEYRIRLCEDLVSLGVLHTKPINDQLTYFLTSTGADVVKALEEARDIFEEI